MKTIVYKKPGTMLSRSGQGKTLEPVGVTVEVPFSEENLQRADAEALPGSLQILDLPDADPEEYPVSKNLVLRDRASGKLYEIFVENGKLMMEVL